MYGIECTQYEKNIVPEHLKLKRSEVKEGLRCRCRQFGFLPIKYSTVTLIHDNLEKAHTKMLVQKCWLIKLEK